MKKIRVTTLLVVLSAVFGILAAVAAESELQRQVKSIQSEEKKTTVLIAKGAIPEHALITLNMVKEVAIPYGGITPGALQNVNQVLGKLATQPIYSGEQILPNFLTDKLTSSYFADRIPAGLVAVSVLYNPVLDAGGKIQAGNRVSVIAVLNKGNNRTHLDASQLIAENVLVLSVPLPGSSANGSAQSAERAINLAVTPEVASQIAFSSVYGQIYIALQPSLGNIKKIPLVVTDQTIE